MRDTPVHWMASDATILILLTGAALLRSVPGSNTKINSIWSGEIADYWRRKRQRAALRCAAASGGIPQFQGQMQALPNERAACRLQAAPFVVHPTRGKDRVGACSHYWQAQLG